MGQHRKLDGARYAVAPPVRGFPDGPTARPWAAAILDNTKDEVEALKIQIGFLPRRPETEAPFCLESYTTIAFWPPPWPRLTSAGRTTTSSLGASTIDVRR